MKTHAIAALVGLFIGLGLMWYIQSGKVEAANSRTLVAVEQRKGAEYDLQQCKLGVDLQNRAIDEMRARAEQANADLAAARAGRAQIDGVADIILQERTPSGQDACTAARNAFADELRRERGQ